MFRQLTFSFHSCAALSNRAFWVKYGTSSHFHSSAVTHNNRRTAYGTSSAPDITIFIYKFEAPKVADSRLLACDAVLQIWRSLTF